MAIKEDRVMMAIGLMLVAYLTFSFIDTSVKWLSVLGLHALQLAFMRYAAHFFISSFLILRETGPRGLLDKTYPWQTIFRGSLIMFSTVLNFISLKYLPLTITSTILFSAPLIVCALSWPVLGERVGTWRMSAILVGFIGIVVTIRPFDESFHPAMFLSLTAAFSFALYSVMTRKLAGLVATNTMQFWSGAVGFFALLPFAVSTWSNPETTLDWVLLLTLGFWGWAGHQLLTIAHRFAPASVLSPFAYSFLLYLTVWSYFLFDHLPDRWTLTGASIIIAAGLVIWYRERQKSKQAAGLARLP